MNSTMSRAALKLHENLTGRGILKRLEELNRTQWLSRDELLALQRDKLQRLVDYAYQYVPYYRRTFDAVGFHPADLCRDPAQFEKLPILTKSIIRENWDDLMTSESERKQKLSKLATSGSTGHPLVFMQDNDFRDAVTADIQRHLGWAGYKLGDRQAYIWGESSRRNFRLKLRKQLIDWIWNRFLTDAFTMTDETMRTFARRILHDRPKILFGYATALFSFAHFVRSSPFQGIQFCGIFATAETLLPPVRLFLEETFQCRVFNRYGTLELGGVACECDAHTGMHISMENNLVEILRDSSSVQPGEVGDIIVTNLNNYGMPFIRYSIGDSGTWYAGGNCSCGRVSTMLKAIEGRLVDSFHTRDGRRVWAGFAGAGFRCLTNPAIKQFQVIQKTVDKMVVRLVQNEEIPQSQLNEIYQAIRASFGDNVAVDFEFVDEIPPLPSGKHQYTMSELTQSQP